MAGASLLTLLDDIATILDDVALMTKVAAKKSAVIADQFKAFFARGDTFALGTCNGCQMFAELADIIPGAEAWPRFTANQSERFEARLSLVEVLDSPSLFFTGMAGSRLPIAVAHGEGYANFAQRGDASQAIAAMRFVDHHGAATEQYPFCLLYTSPSPRD